MRAGLEIHTREYVRGLERDATRSRLMLPLRNFTPTFCTSTRGYMNPTPRLYPLNISSNTEPTERTDKTKCSPALCTTPDPKRIPSVAHVSTWFVKLLVDREGQQLTNVHSHLGRTRYTDNPSPRYKRLAGRSAHE